jgi:hydroxymethylglutaryl-CoA synthase
MSDQKLLKPKLPVGIVGYGAYVPRYRLPASEVSRIWTDGKGGLPVKEKAVAGIDEDVATMSIEAARNALARAEIEPEQLRAVWVGSESHPYAVKPTSTIVAEAIGAVPDVQAADWQFACKAGTEAMVAAIGFVGSGMAPYAMAIGMDIAQGKPGDALEYTAAAGGAAYLLGASTPLTPMSPIPPTSGAGHIRSTPSTGSALPVNQPTSPISPRLQRN